MKTAALVVGFLLAASMRGEVPTLTGPELLEACGAAVSGMDGKQASRLDTRFCFGYVLGFRVGFNTGLLAAHHQGQDLICFPEKATLGQLARVLETYLRAHPERLHESPYLLTVEAFLAAFPCKAPAGKDKP